MPRERDEEHIRNSLTAQISFFNVFRHARTARRVCTQVSTLGEGEDFLLKMKGKRSPLFHFA